MELFEVRDNIVYPTTDALMTKPFRQMWENDETPNKEEAMKMFRFVHFYCSPKKSNGFYGYDPDRRYVELKKEIYDDPDYVLDDMVVDGIIKYEELLENASPTFSFLRTALKSTEKLKEFLETVDLYERTKSGGAVYKPADIARTLTEVPDIAKSIESLQEKVNQELLNEAKTRNSREIGYFER